MKVERTCRSKKKTLPVKSWLLFFFFRLVFLWWVFATFYQKSIVMSTFCWSLHSLIREKFAGQSTFVRLFDHLMLKKCQNNLRNVVFRHLYQYWSIKSFDVTHSLLLFQLIIVSWTTVAFCTHHHTHATFNQYYFVLICTSLMSTRLPLTNKRKMIDNLERNF